MSDCSPCLFSDGLSDIRSFGIQFLPTTICPLPIKEPENYRIESRSGKVTLDVVGGRYGVPHGRDNLIVLWLILLSKKQGQRRIAKPTIYDFLKTFDIQVCSKNYDDAKSRLLRIIYSNWTWTISEKTDTGIYSKALNINIVSESLLLWDPYRAESTNTHDRSLFEEYIELSEGFYNTIKNYKIPYRIDIVKSIQNAPTLLNLYLFLSYRSYSVWRLRQSGFSDGVLKIPLFGDNGLKNQLGSHINNRSFKLRLKGYLSEIKRYWPNCPANIDYDLTPLDKSRRKNTGDRLVIHIKDASDLDVIPNIDYEIAKSIKS